MGRFSITRKGYCPQEVEQAMAETQQKLEKLEQELVSYRVQEETIHKAAVEAQIKADAMIAAANEEAERIRLQSAGELMQIRRQAMEIREILEAFQNEYNQLLRQYLIRIRMDEFPALLDRLGVLIERTGGERFQKEEES